jgi:excisionase family DNA binding protein
MEKNIDTIRQNLLILIDDWMKQLDSKEEEVQEVREEKSVSPVLSVRELADFLGVSTDSVYTMVREKQIPYFRVRRRILFHRSSVEQWCKKNEEELGLGL